MEEVPTIRFDDYILGRGLKQVRLMKIDVEGAEMMVLQGARNFLERRCANYLIIEINDSRLRETGCSSAEVVGFLRNCGYRLSRIGIFGVKPLGLNEQISFANIFAEAS